MKGWRQNSDTYTICHFANCALGAEEKRERSRRGEDGRRGRELEGERGVNE